MTQNDIIATHMSIARRRALLKLDIDHEKRSVIERLLAEAEDSLALANGNLRGESRLSRRAAQKESDPHVKRIGGQPSD